MGVAGAVDRMDRGGERLGHRRRVRRQSVGDRVQGGRGRGEVLREPAEDPVRVPADLGAPGAARRARATRDRVGHQHPLAGVGPDARRLVAERARVRRQHAMPVAPHLHVGPAGGGCLDLDQDRAVRRLRVGDPLHTEVLGAVEQRGLHGSTTTFRAVALRWRSSALAVWSSGRRCETSGVGSIQPLAIRSSAASMSPGPAE